MNLEKFVKNGLAAQKAIELGAINAVVRAQRLERSRIRALKNRNPVQQDKYGRWSHIPGSVGSSTKRLAELKRARWIAYELITPHATKATQEAA